MSDPISGKNSVKTCVTTAHNGGVKLTTTNDKGKVIKEQFFSLDGGNVTEYTYCQPEDGFDCVNTGTQIVNSLMHPKKVDEAKEKLLAKKE